MPTSHPQFRPHLMQGWTTDFVPALVQRAQAEGLIDCIVGVPGEAALATARDMACREGILAGISGGATVAGALQLAATLPAGSRLLAMVPDTGERYLSTPLFADIAAGMDEAEWAISRSTPRSRFDVPSPPSPAMVAPAIPAREAVAFVDAAVADASHPALMFGLRWCEFCWALRRLFERIGAPLHEIHVDDPELQAGGLAGELRAALAARCGAVTLPQLFVGGRHVGGCTDAVAAWDDGGLARLLRRAEVPFDAAAHVDTRSLMPAWVQSR